MRSEELPDGLSQPEQCLFLSFRQLYRDFNAKAIDREQAKREKQCILKKYENFKQLYDMFFVTMQRWNKAELFMPEIEKSETDCPTCYISRKIIRILDGREKCR